MHKSTIPGWAGGTHKAGLLWLRFRQTGRGRLGCRSGTELTSYLHSLHSTESLQNLHSVPSLSFGGLPLSALYVVPNGLSFSEGVSQVDLHIPSFSSFVFGFPIRTRNLMLLVATTEILALIIVYHIVLAQIVQHSPVPNECASHTKRNANYPDL